MAGIKDRAAIVGIGETEYSMSSGRSELQLACEAILKAVEDAGLSIKDVDGITKLSGDSTSEALIATTMGIPNLRFFGEIGYGGGGSHGTVVHAAMAVASGMADVVVCFRALNGQSRRGVRRGGGDGRMNYGERSFGDPYGLLAPAQFYAILARRHMYEYGTTSEQFGAVAVAQRRHASMNPRAQMREPITLADHQHSRMIADPFRLLDCCLQTDGGCAVVVTSAERARELRQPPAYILGAAQGTGFLPCAGHNRPDLQILTQGQQTAREVFRVAEVEPKDIKAVEIYDHFSWFPIATLEAYGFCGIGEGGPFVESGRIEIGGELPLNTHGGLLSEGYMQGLNHVLEATRQIRGTSTAQVPNADLVLSCGASMEPSSALILRR